MPVIVCGKIGKHNKQMCIRVYSHLTPALSFFFENPFFSTNKMAVILSLENTAC